MSLVTSVVSRIWHPSALVWVLALYLVPMVLRVFAAIGLGFVTFTGVNAGVDVLRDAVRDHLSGLPELMLALLSIAHIDTAFGIILGAYVGRATVRGLTASGVLRRPRWGRPRDSLEA